MVAPPTFMGSSAQHEALMTWRNSGEVRGARRSRPLRVASSLPFLPYVRHARVGTHLVAHSIRSRWKSVLSHPMVYRHRTYSYGHAVWKGPTGARQGALIWDEYNGRRGFEELDPLQSIQSFHGLFSFLPSY